MFRKGVPGDELDDTGGDSGRRREGARRNVEQTAGFGQPLGHDGEAAIILAAGGYLLARRLSISEDALVRIIIDFLMPMLVFYALYDGSVQAMEVARLAGSVNELKVIVDGRFAWNMDENDSLEVESSNKPLRLICSPKKGYFEILRSKLNWGGLRQMVMDFDLASGKIMRPMFDAPTGYSSYGSGLTAGQSKIDGARSGPAIRTGRQPAG